MSAAKMEPNQKIDILHFKILNHLLCIELNNIERVIKLVELQTVPGAPAYFKGLLNLAGTEIPVIDIGERLGFETQTIYTLNTPIIICKLKDKRMGLIVEDVVGIESLSEKKLQMSEVLEKSSHRFIQGSLITEQGDALLLNIDSLFDLNLS